MNSGRGNVRKLQLNRETVRLLSSDKLVEVVGGATTLCAVNSPTKVLLTCITRQTFFDPCNSQISCPTYTETIGTGG